MLVKRSKVCGLEKKMVQSKLDFTKKDTLYEQTETALSEVLGAGPGESTKPAASAYVAVPEEDGVFLIGGKKYKLATKPKKRKKTDKEVKKKKNKIGPDGKPMRCFNCKSEYHFAGSEDCSTKKSNLLRLQMKSFLLRLRRLTQFWPRVRSRASRGRLVGRQRWTRAAPRRWPASRGWTCTWRSWTTRTWPRWRVRWSHPEHSASATMEH